MNTDGHRLAPQPARFRTRTLPCCVADPPAAEVTTPNQPVPPRGGSHIDRRQRIRRAPDRSAAKLMYRFLPWVVPRVQKFLRRQRPLLGGRRQATLLDALDAGRSSADRRGRSGVGGPPPTHRSGSALGTDHMLSLDPPNDLSYSGTNERRGHRRSPERLGYRTRADTFASGHDIPWRCP